MRQFESLPTVISSAGFNSEIYLLSADVHQLRRGFTPLVRLESLYYAANPKHCRILATRPPQNIGTALP
jgi:hypothetical protein